VEVGDDLGWASLGRNRPDDLGLLQELLRKTVWADKLNWVELNRNARRNSFSNSNKVLDLKLKYANTFKPNLNWGQTKINLNTLFEVFSNLKLLKISLNIQIQTKALNK
jgi:hypothetical protein